MNGDLSPANTLADAKQGLVDYFTAIVYRFSLSDNVMIFL
jgi:hypothetical protein